MVENKRGLGYLGALSTLDWIMVGLVTVITMVGFWQFYLPYSAERNYRDGFNYSAANRNDIAIRYFDQAVRNAPWEAQYLIELARAYQDYAHVMYPGQRLELLTKASIFNKRAMALDVRNPWFLNRQAAIDMELAALEPQKSSFWIRQAEGYVKSAAESDRYNPLFQLGLGYFYHQQGKIDLAEALYKRVVHMDGHMLEARYNLADILIKRRQFLAAQAQYRAIYKQDPGFQRVRAILGRLYGAEGNLQLAEKLFLEDVASRNLELEPLVNLAGFYANQGKWAKAADFYQKATLRFPDAHLNELYTMAKSKAGG